MNVICSWYGISRQAHYQQRQRALQRSAEAEQALLIVRAKRQKHTHMGTRKLLNELREAFAAAGIRMSRDRLFKLLREAGLLVRRRRKRARTTWPGSWRSENLLQGLRIERANQAWVSDLTYIVTEEGFVYLCLIMDVYSRCILGYDVSDSLAVEGSLRALQMAIANADGDVAETILHSDHGIQYTCHAFRAELAAHQMRSSMGERGNCYENALAERLNGILKQEYALGDCFVILAHARRAAMEAIYLYNCERPHLSLDYRKPRDVYRARQVSAY